MFKKGRIILKKSEECEKMSKCLKMSKKPEKFVKIGIILKNAKNL